MLWFKAFHIVFVAAWFAGLFYLPRLFVYHAEATEPVVRERLKVMERRLLVMTNIGAVATLVFGVLTVLQVPGFLQTGWMHAKLTLVLGLYGYHGWLVRLTKQFARDACTRSPRWLRVFNEVPVLFLIAIVVLVVVKPF
ncbi:protoporphyrinogen oxidase HemJ [Tahibacter soli]|jgi:putative membrane protein|uniref:Protoporphyrinogen IX oxidase n=1 Tax=Tahibacter soli TaxID=2983605 RepID=A0A9X3YMJ6_9GAMM|nr:protoporphyrinogen oxidase HemJ [Tahibacter soli]MDC8013488.1 protoporphyrinogen oxidase HemJ [Tahibacter soli]